MCRISAGALLVSHQLSTDTFTEFKRSIQSAPLFVHESLSSWEQILGYKPRSDDTWYSLGVLSKGHEIHNLLHFRQNWYLQYLQGTTESCAALCCLCHPSTSLIQLKMMYHLTPSSSQKINAIPTSSENNTEIAILNTTSGVTDVVMEDSNNNERTGLMH